MKRIYAIEKWCLQCKLCEVACKTAHSKSKDTVKAFMLEGSTLQTRIHVEGDSFMSIAVNCRHCDEPACVDGCIAGAMQRNPETGAVFCDPSKFLGCRTCMTMCPYGCVHVEHVGNKGQAIKCDMCSEELGVPGEPSCVAACPNRALIYVESEA